MAFSYFSCLRRKNYLKLAGEVGHKFCKMGYAHAEFEKVCS